MRKKNEQDTKGKNSKKKKFTYQEETDSEKVPTLGEEALKLSAQGYSQEVGETYNEMAKDYDKEMRECLNINKNHDHYYIVVLRKKEHFFDNVLRQWFCAPRFTKPSSMDLKFQYPLHDHDVWEVKNGSPSYLWTLPGPDAWSHILRNPISHDKKLVNWMELHMQGKDI